MTKKIGEKHTCENCYWNDEDEPYSACIISRGTTGDDLCIGCGGKINRWEPWPSAEIKKPKKKLTLKEEIAKAELEAFQEDEGDR